MELTRDDLLSFKHDLNNALHVIQNFGDLGAEMIKKDNVDLEKLQLMFERISSKVQEIAQMTKDTLSDAVSPSINMYDTLSEHKYKIESDYDVKVSVYKAKSNKDFCLKKSELTRLIDNIFANSVSFGANKIDIALVSKWIIFRDDGDGFTREALSNLKTKQFSSRAENRGQGFNFLKKFAEKYNMRLHINNDAATGGAIIKFERSDA